MSAYGDIIDALLAATVFSSYETSREYVPPERIKSFPFVYGFMRGEQAERLGWQQEAREYDAAVVIFTNAESQEQLYTRIDAIVDEFYGAADRTLGGLVDSYHIASVVPFELNAPHTTKGAAFTFTIRRDA